MADNVYLLETRLSQAQQAALEAVRLVARQQGLTVFLVGGAVRDLISGSPVRDLDVVVQGNALKLRKQLEEVGAAYSGESTNLQSLYVRFPNGVRVEVGTTLSVSFPKPGKPVYEPTTILDDLRRRDFTANAMALSLNEGSYGLLMDPLNGVADIENRELRLVSNYGFLEDPARLIRASRFMARLGWQMDERTRGRYETAKEENYVEALQPWDRAYEVEELFHEEEPLRVMRRLEEEGWLKHLSPLLSVAKANASELARLRESQMQLESRGIRADAAAANFPLLTGKIPTSDLEALKKTFPRASFVTEINTLETAAKELSTQLLSKAMSLPSEAYKLILRSDPVTVLWALHSSKSAALQTRLKSFMNEWPQAQQKIPILLMAEMRITPELPAYAELQETLFYALMDGRLSTPEEMRAFLESYSPPAPPPPVSLRRPRAPRKEAKPAKLRKKAAADVPTDDEALSPAAAGETPVGTADQPAALPQKAPKRDEKINPASASQTRPVRPAPVKKTPAESPTPIAKAIAKDVSVSKKMSASPRKSKTPATPSRGVTSRKGSAPKPAVKTQATAMVSNRIKSKSKTARPAARKLSGPKQVTKSPKKAAPPKKTPVKKIVAKSAVTRNAAGKKSPALKKLVVKKVAKKK